MSRPSSAAEPIEAVIDGFTHGGEGVTRIDGKAVFVSGTLPGERVSVRIVDDRARWARAEVIEILSASPDRVEPPCPYVPECGGCDLQHASVEAQLRLKTRVVVEQLQRIGGIAEPPVAACRAVGPALGYRNHAQFHAAADGRLGFHRRGSHDVIPIDACAVLSEGVQKVRDAFSADTGARELAVRAQEHPAAATAVVTPGTGGLQLPAGDFDVVLAQPDGRVMPMRGTGELAIAIADWVFSVPADGFFQVNTAGAEVLIEEVLAAAGDLAGAGVWDLYAGVGLLSIPLASAGAYVTAVESHPSSVRHLDANADRNDVDLDVVNADVDDLLAGTLGHDTPEEPDVIVLDPPRAGAGQQAAKRLSQLSPATIVYVACDVAAFARDARVLVAAGYRLTSVTPLDLFPMTHHVETVAAFQR